jgi:hypothetical protein
VSPETEGNVKQRAVVTAVLAAAVALIVSVAALGGSGGAGGKAKTAETIAVYGDSPYGTSNADTAQKTATPAFIDTINADPDAEMAHAR